MTVVVADFFLSFAIWGSTTTVRITGLAGGGRHAGEHPPRHPGRAHPAVRRRAGLPQRHRAAGRDLDRDLQQDLRRRRPPSRSGPTGPACSSRSSATSAITACSSARCARSTRTAQGGHHGRPRAGGGHARSPRTSGSRSCRPRCSARSTSRSPTRSSPASETLTDGDVIPSSRVTTNVELSQILADLFPLLRAVRPADLNATLNALATALEGRGEKIGQSLERLDTYLTASSRTSARSAQDLVALADVHAHLQVATPDLMRLLRNATVTSRTIVDKRAAARRLLRRRRRGVVDDQPRARRQRGRPDPLRRALAADDAAPRHLLARVPLPAQGPRPLHEPRCVRSSGTTGSTRSSSSGRRRSRAYDKNDKPVYGEVGHGPWCLGLPYPKVPIGPNPLKDGSDNDSNPSQSQLPGTSSADPLKQLFGRRRDHQRLRRNTR